MTVLHYIFLNFILSESIVSTKSLHAEHDLVESTSCFDPDNQFYSFQYNAMPRQVVISTSSKLISPFML